MVPSKAEEVIKEKLRNTPRPIEPTESADNRTETTEIEPTDVPATTTDATAAQVTDTVTNGATP